METIELKLYKFSELTKAAQEKALEEWTYGLDYFWGDDAIKSLSEFAKHFDSDLTDYSIDWNYAPGSYVKFSLTDQEYTEKELLKLIKGMGSYNKETLQGNGDCVFTGYSGDEDVADGARKAYFAGERDIKALLDAGFDSWIKACVSDFEYQQTAEYFDDFADANDYVFTENGKRFIIKKFVNT